jgi:hypothetical protein
MEEQRKGKEEKREDPDEIASFRSTFHRTGGGKEQRSMGERENGTGKMQRSYPVKFLFVFHWGKNQNAKSLIHSG